MQPARGGYSFSEAAKLHLTRDAINMNTSPTYWGYSTVLLLACCLLTGCFAWHTRVESIPSDAQLYYNDKYIGVTPLDSDDAMKIPFAIHRYRVETAGYEPMTSTYREYINFINAVPRQQMFHLAQTPTDRQSTDVATTGSLAPRSGTSLPTPTWSPENIAIADLTAYTLTHVEAKTLTEALHATLVQTKYFKVFSRSEMKAVLEAQQFQQSDACDESACLVEMGKILAVQKIIGGSIGKVGNTFSIVLTLVDVETGGTECSSERKLKAEADQLLDLVEEVGIDLARKYAETKQ